MPTQTIKSQDDETPRIKKLSRTPKSTTKSTAKLASRSTTKSTSRSTTRSASKSITRKKSDNDITLKCRTIDSYFAKKAKNVPRMEPKKLSKIFDDVARIEEGPLKGLPSSLLDKIKDKSTENEKDVRKVLLQKLPDLMKIVHFYFMTNPKPIQLETLINKCISSYYTYISVPDADQQIRLICEVFPEWVTIVNIRKQNYVKLLDKTKSLKELNDKISIMTQS